MAKAWIACALRVTILLVLIAAPAWNAATHGPGSPAEAGALADTPDHGHPHPTDADPTGHDATDHEHPTQALLIAQGTALSALARRRLRFEAARRRDRIPDGPERPPRAA